MVLPTSRQIREVVGGLHDELLQLAIDLVRIPSITGDEAALQGWLGPRLQEWGLAVETVTPDEEQLRAHPAFCDDGNNPVRPSLVARYGNPADRAALILNGHVDVVPTGARQLWDAEPFSGRVHRKRLWGRGACDMKGGLAAAAMALRAVQLMGLEPTRPVLLQCVVGEETGGVGTLATLMNGPSADLAVIAEPTGLDLCPLQSGALSFRLSVPGVASHGATRELGISAYEKLHVLYEALRKLETDRHQNYRHPLFHGGLAAPLSVGVVQVGEWISTVPDAALAEGRYGVFVGESVAVAKQQFEDAVRNACLSDDFLREHPARVEWIEGQFEPGATDPDLPVVQRVVENHREMLGRDPVQRGVPYGSDLRLFTNHAGIPAILYGPGELRLAHAANEHLELEELQTATAVMAGLIARSIA